MEDFLSALNFEPSHPNNVMADHEKPMQSTLKTFFPWAVHEKYFDKVKTREIFSWIFVLIVKIMKGCVWVGGGGGEGRVTYQNYLKFQFSNYLTGL